MVYHKPCQIIFLVCQLIKQVYVIKKRGVTARAGYERVKVIEQLTRFGVQMHCVSRDKILQNHVIKDLLDIMIRTPSRYMHCGHMHCGI